ncbi:MAG: hypothetical protein A2268_02845 [Candidatus Raymondbacteria bacterium RifOxyA12_full_50_37]|uniref:DUF4143 domain-containing protein n=1 Tax=Candidatus Raymondbacteria bacterium RIFOXYD12_FULL_49_13 TaxID=1817890 RepID=A0A1F7F2F0_UNCRA|nr:MAG: hypothetical protein A2268_02845 [Candidatus Raymondbacteria bacterium RifOxyA12_full_50_37]OGJ85920.1 MAG: hypothetical protein A2248_15610 [Candidatus Raymondbacteria bacterium RIFOXYA2_FULL_49_16]OGJ95914.1 MAG: hypothetical protein A2453_01170 [Candidatus Raymondbacteria bacterium RIFOXYC2_FULL_50_21]OGJ96250.1 MAG: hypothetical protein A2487_02850 [Candidatus Raymondbacteria bacterium RifOxyC12_full_50_8]OGK00778.1 MAG: hypothetical protein A2519_14655 [Candidatus Raymondbacteria b
MRGADVRAVDFVVYQDNRVQRLIQVCWDPGDPLTREREMRALVTAGNDLACKDLLMLTRSVEKVKEFSWFGRSGTVRSMPVRKWLMEAESDGVAR